MPSKLFTCWPLYGKWPVPNPEQAGTPLAHAHEPQHFLGRSHCTSSLVTHELTTTLSPSAPLVALPGVPALVSLIN